MSFSILLVEDDTVLRGGLCELFEREGYAVEAAASASEARVKYGPAIDLIVLDVTLPDGDGVSLCRRWRGEGVQQPILFLTAKDEEFDIVRGLDAGGNDYVTKPFRMQELLSRIRAQLRASSAQQVVRGTLEIDQTRMQVKKDGEDLLLTLTEYKILMALVKRGTVVTRDMLLEALWDEGGKFVDDNTLSVHVSRLKNKIGAQHIRTVRGVGYQWND